LAAAREGRPKGGLSIGPENVKASEKTRRIQRTDDQGAGRWPASGRKRAHRKKRRRGNCWDSLKGGPDKTRGYRKNHGEWGSHQEQDKEKGWVGEGCGGSEGS